jgi:hypothetical protein
MKNILRKYIKESLRRFLINNGHLENCESFIQAEVSTLAGASIAGHISSSGEKDLSDELEQKKKDDSDAKSFGGGSYSR